MMKTIYRNDYTPPHYAVEQIHLTFELDPADTYVHARMIVDRIDHAEDASFTLMGEHVTLHKIKLNDRELTADEYTVTDTELTLHNVPAHFTLDITTLIHPEKNTALDGLYFSNGLFCTQCEAHGFRRIMYFLDRPDVMTTYTTKLIADKQRYPTLLSNGNLIDSGELPDGKHFATWQDPYKKPCYLFAVVAGALDCLESHYTTHSGREVTLRIFSDIGEKNRCHHAMESVKQAMHWDEKHFGREYDLDIHMIVAVSAFNMGAMENKGLNIFNSKYILADRATATDTDFEGIQSVIGHEYFHNWTGNRITCRDWFQLSLKEGLTVFRDQEFTADMGSRAITRIDDVCALRSMQFPEDAGPMAHPVRPDAYIEVNNFYTATVYNKGAEVIRMMQTLLTPAGFRRGMDLYFDRHDGEAVTCDDFVQALSDANHVDLTQFKLWYSQAGTPVVSVTAAYNAAEKRYTLTFTQTCPPTPGQVEKAPMHIPFALALFDHQGNKIVADQVTSLTDMTQEIHFDHVSHQPVPSLLRGFSAPIKLQFNYAQDDLYTLFMHDDDAFNRWEAGQRLAFHMLDDMMAAYKNQQQYHLSERYLAALQHILTEKETDMALIARLVQLPSVQQIADRYTIDVPVEAIVTAHHTLRETIAVRLYDAFLARYQAIVYNHDPAVNTDTPAARQLQNTCLYYLAYSTNEDAMTMVITQYHEADTMTNCLAALNIMASQPHPTRAKLLDDFYDRWQQNNLVIEKWFGIQAMSELPDTLDTVQALLQHSAFNYHSPNKIRALIGAFVMYNYAHFHNIDGSGYNFLAEQVLLIDKLNPQVAARILTPLTYWRPQQSLRQDRMHQALTMISEQPRLSPNVFEVVEKALKP